MEAVGCLLIAGLMLAFRRLAFGVSPLATLWPLARYFPLLWLRSEQVNRFDGYDTHELGLHMVNFQVALEKCTSKQVYARTYIKEMIRSIARELLYRYRQETALLYR